MTGIRSTTGQRRPKGTGTTAVRAGRWVAIAPQEPGTKPLTVSRGHAFQRQAEQSLNSWLKTNRPDAYVALMIGRGEQCE